MHRCKSYNQSNIVKPNQAKNCFSSIIQFSELFETKIEIENNPNQEISFSQFKRFNEILVYIRLSICFVSNVSLKIVYTDKDLRQS